MFLFSILKRRRLRRTSVVLVVVLPVCFLLFSFIGIRDKSIRNSDSGLLPVPMGYGILGCAIAALKSDSSHDGQHNCVHPQLQLWHPEVKPYFVPPTPLKCNTAE